VPDLTKEGAFGDVLSDVIASLHLASCCGSYEDFRRLAGKCIAMVVELALYIRDVRKHRCRIKADYWAVEVDR
jgi:hypothetical protein